MIQNDDDGIAKQKWMIIGGFFLTVKKLLRALISKKINYNLKLRSSRSVLFVCAITDALMFFPLIAKKKMLWYVCKVMNYE